jgi:HlyD family secretion protein
VPKQRIRSVPVAATGLPLVCLAMFVMSAWPGAARAAAEPEGAAASGGVSSLGRIEPHHGIIHLGAPSTPQAISGSIVARLFVEAGDDVKAGQVLAETDSHAYEQAGVEVAEASLQLAQHQAEAAIGQEQDVCSRADVASRTSARRARLFRDGVTSDEEADVAAGDAKALSGSCSAARLATKAAQSTVVVREAELRRARLALDRSTIKAPMDGRILRIAKRPGELIDLHGILEMGDVSSMYAIAEVYETDISRVKKGQKATVTSKALAAPLSGVVDVVRAQVRKQDATGTDPASRKDARIVEVEVKLDDPKPVARLTNLQVEVLIHP